MVKENKKNSSEPVDSQLTQLAETLSKATSELPKKYVERFVEDMQQAAERRKSYYLHIAGRSSRSYVMNDLRERIVEWKPRIVYTPHELARELPYASSSIRSALQTLYSKDEEVDIARITDDFDNLWFKPETQNKTEIFLRGINLDEWVKKIEQVELQWFPSGPYCIPIHIEASDILPMLIKAVGEKDVSDLNKICDYHEARLKEPTEMGLMLGLSKEFESFWQNYAQRLGEKGCVNLREENRKIADHLSNYRFKDSYSNKLALTSNTIQQLTLFILEELRSTGLSSAMHNGESIALYCPTLIRKTRERKFFK